MNYGSAGGLHDTATYLTLKMDISRHSGCKPATGKCMGKRCKDYFSEKITPVIRVFWCR